MNNKKLSVIFAGTPDISAFVLDELIQSDKINLTGIFTQPDRPKGRGKKLQSSPVKDIALKNNLPVFQPISFKKEPQYLEELKNLKPDLMIVIAYGLILPKAVLDIPKYGCINIHVSLLPKWRGAAPIQRAIEAGDTETGVSIMQMNEGLDTGDILNLETCPILKTDTAQSLHDKLAKLSIKPLLKTLDEIKTNTLKPIKQPKDGSYAKKIEKQEGQINWQLNANKIDCQIRALTPWPSAFTNINNESVKIIKANILDKKHSKIPGEVLSVSKSGIEVACGESSILNLTTLQFPGKKALSISDILNGKDLSQLVGKQLGV